MNAYSLQTSSCPVSASFARSGADLLSADLSPESFVSPAVVPSVVTDALVVVVVDGVVVRPLWGRDVG